MGWAFAIAILLNGAFVAAEFAASVIYNSMGLAADAGHNLGDVSGLLISLGAFLLSRKRILPGYTYGLRKGTIWAALLNAVILLVAVGAIVIECLRKFQNPVPLAGAPIMITAGVGIFINGCTALLFWRGRANDLNIRGAFQHMMADTLVSIGVVISGLLISWTGFHIIDPIVGLIIAAVILWSTWELLCESVRLAMDGVPAGICQKEIQEHLQKIPGVQSLHHLHIWAISTTENALTVHVVLEDFGQLESCRSAIREELAHHGISHSTLEFESPDTHCQDADGHCHCANPAHGH